MTTATESPAQAGRRTKTIQEYMAEPPTANQAAFLQFVLDHTGIKFKTKAEEEAFNKGVKAAGLYGRYQASKRAGGSASPVAETARPEPQKVPPRRRQAAAAS